MNKDKIVAKHQERKTRSMCGKTLQNTKPKLEKGESRSLDSRSNLCGEDPHKDVRRVRGAGVVLAEFGNRLREMGKIVGQLKIAKGCRLLLLQATNLLVKW